MAVLTRALAWYYIRRVHYPLPCRLLAHLFHGADTNFEIGPGCSDFASAEEPNDSNCVFIRTSPPYPRFIVVVHGVWMA